jgi:hypothetical protein
LEEEEEEEEEDYIKVYNKTYYFLNTTSSR